MLSSPRHQGPGIFQMREEVAVVEMGDLETVFHGPHRLHGQAQHRQYARRANEPQSS